MADIRSKRLRRIRTQAFLTCFLSLGTLIAAGSATFAWFTTNKTATAKYLNIVSTDNSIIKSVTYYKIASISDNKYTFTDVATSYDLGEYDSALGDNKHQILIKIEFKDGTNEEVTLKAIANSDILNGGNNWNTVAQKDGVSWMDTDNFPLSSIIKFDYFGATADTTTTSGSIIVEKTDAISTAETSFITLNNNVPSYKTSFSIGNETGAGNAPIYVMLDYKEDSIESIYSENIGKEPFESSDGLTFKCDFSIMVSTN